MRELLVALRDICLLRMGPQDLPYAPNLLVTLIALNLLLDVTVGWLLGLAGAAITGSLLGVLVILGGVWLLLRMRGFEARFVQAATAISGAALLFSILAIPANVALTPMPKDPELFSSGQKLALFMAMLLGAWSLAVTAHILRHALQRPFWIALLLAVMLNVATAALFPAAQV